MDSICTLPRINSACHSVLEKQVILNDSLIEKDCMSGTKGLAESLQLICSCVCDMLPAGFKEQTLA